MKPMSVMEQKTHRVPAGNDQLAVLLAISALYIGFGMTMGLFQGGFPAIMREQGMSLGTVNWLYALYLPRAWRFCGHRWLTAGGHPFLPWN